MYRRLTFFLLGAVVGPIATSVVRPALKGILKNVLVIAYEAKAAAQQVREDFQDVHAEAVAEAAASSSPGAAATPTAKA